MYCRKVALVLQIFGVSFNGGSTVTIVSIIIIVPTHTCVVVPACRHWCGGGGCIAG